VLISGTQYVREGDANLRFSFLSPQGYQLYQNSFLGRDSKTGKESRGDIDL
jgi:hypothetical protein